MHRHLKERPQAVKSCATATYSLMVFAYPAYHVACKRTRFAAETIFQVRKDKDFVLWWSASVSSLF